MIASLMRSYVPRGRRTAVTVEQLNRDSPREVMAAVEVAAASLEVANRAHKADRLPLSRIERTDHKLPVGCESVVGSFTPSPLSHVARDCQFMPILAA
jgi:hypothetical protein